MAEHIHNPHSTGSVTGVHHQQQSPPQAPYPWNNGLSTDVSFSKLFVIFFISISFICYFFIIFFI
jgi:hypothetical protein